jgi:hypothetical protein
VLTAVDPNSARANRLGVTLYKETNVGCAYAQLQPVQHPVPRNPERLSSEEMTLCLRSLHG